jgi:hypothetical protein
MAKCLGQNAALGNGILGMKNQTGAVNEAVALMRAIRSSSIRIGLA